MGNWRGSGRVSQMTLGLALGGYLCLSSCSSGSSGGGTTATAAQVNLQTLSGRVLQSGNQPLSGVTVSVGCASAVSDAWGNFLISSIGMRPAGMVAVEFDGSTAAQTGALPFPKVLAMTALERGAMHVNLTRPVTIPDLNGPNSATQFLFLFPDGSTGTAIDVLAAGIRLEGPVGTVLLEGDAPCIADVALNVTLVDASEIPAALPAELMGASFVNIHPDAVSFSPALDLSIPNTLNFPLQSELDIWAFNPQQGAWVNRSLETGRTGRVVQDSGGNRIDADGVVTRGGLYAAVFRVAADCTTTMVGRVVDCYTSVGIGDALIEFGAGRSTRTDVDGFYRLPGVPAFDAGLFATNGTCQAIPLPYRAFIPSIFGGTNGPRPTLPAASIVFGGETPVPDLDVRLGMDGNLAGVVLGDRTPDAMVNLRSIGSSVGMDVPVSPNGTFFAAPLTPGDYVAQFTFADAERPIVANFAVQQDVTSTLVLQLAMGSGTEDITVLVLEKEESNPAPPIPCPGAMVRLQGSDSDSVDGLDLMTDAEGRVVFNNVTRPFNITAVKDVLIGSVVTRSAVSLVAIEPSTDTVGLLINRELARGRISSPNATFEGTLINLPAQQTGVQFNAYIRQSGAEGGGFSSNFAIDASSGNFLTPVRENVPFDLLVARVDSSQEFGVLEAKLFPGFGPIANGGTLDVELDFAGALAFDQPTAIDFSRARFNSALQLELVLLDEGRGEHFAIPLHASMQNGDPISLKLPASNAIGLGVLRPVLRASTSVLNNLGRREAQECRLHLEDNAPNRTLEFLNMPSPLLPREMSNLDPFALDRTVLSFFESVDGPLGSNGVTLLDMQYFLGDGTPPSGVDQARWSIVVPPGVQGFVTPSPALPVFGALHNLIQGRLSTLRATGIVLDPNVFFSSGLAGNLAALEGPVGTVCDSSREFVFQVND